jgi:hypothetical protein
MPPGYVKTIGDEIHYEYAKLISRSALDGELNYGFISNRFKALREGKATMSGTLREWQREHELPVECVFCGATSALQTDHLIPKRRGGPDTSNNVVWACRACNASRGDKGVFAWLGLKEKDKLHRIVAGKYLKELHALHERAGTLGVGKGNIAELCERCGNGEVCAIWGTQQKLTCLCLESAF